MCENLLMGSVFTHQWNVQAMKRYIDKDEKKKAKPNQKQKYKIYYRSTEINSHGRKESTQ